MYAATFYFPNMTVRHVYKVCPVFIIYSDFSLLDDQGATTRGLIVIIRPKYKNDLLTESHELIHAKQAYRTCFWGWIKAKFDHDYLARWEAEAYAIEITNYSQIDSMARMIKDEYSLDTDVNKIKEYLFEYWDDCTRRETCFKHIQAS